MSSGGAKQSNFQKPASGSKQLAKVGTKQASAPSAKAKTSPKAVRKIQSPRRDVLPKKIAKDELLRVPSFKIYSEMKAKAKCILEKWSYDPKKTSLEQKALMGNSKPIKEDYDLHIDKKREAALRIHELEDLRTEEEDLQQRLELVCCALTEMHRLHAIAVENEEEERIKLTAEHEQYLKERLELVRTLEERQQNLEQLTTDSLSQSTPVDDKLKLLMEQQEVTDALHDLDEEVEKENVKFKERMKTFENSIETRRAKDLSDITKYDLLRKKLEQEMMKRKVVEKYLKAQNPEMPPNSNNQDNSADPSVLHPKIQAAYVEMDKSPKPHKMPDQKSLFTKFGIVVKENVIKRQTCFKMQKATIFSEDGQSYGVAATVLNLSDETKDSENHKIEEGIKLVSFTKKHACINLVHVVELFTIEKSIVIVHEQLAFDLASVIGEEGPLDEENACTYGRQLAHGMEYLYNIGISHGHIDVENIYISYTQSVRLGRLEHSSRFWNVENACIIPKQANDTKKGTFIAPEVSSGSQYDPIKADVYSFSMVLCYTLLGNYPYDSERDEEEDQQWQKANSIIMSKVKRHCADFIYRTSLTDPDGRINIHQLVTDPWLNKKTP